MGRARSSRHAIYDCDPPLRGLGGLVDGPIAVVAGPPLPSLVRMLKRLSGVL